MATAVLKMSKSVKFTYWKLIKFVKREKSECKNENPQPTDF